MKSCGYRWNWCRMASGRISFGSKQLSAALNKYGSAIEADVKRIVAETARIIQSNAKALAPVDDGALRDSIEVSISNGGLTAEVTVGQFYSIFVEFGTGIYAKNGDGRQGGWTYYSDKLGRFVWTEGMKPSPFWFPSVEIGRRYFYSEMRKLG